MVIDDLGNHLHCCDILLNQNITSSGHHFDHGQFPSSTEVLAGPRYALLRPEYRYVRKRRVPTTGKVKRIFVFFGGTDAHNLTGRALLALGRPEFQYVAIDVLVGSNNPHKSTLGDWSASLSNVTLHEARPHLVDLMASADLAIGAGGTTTWERCCLGLPSVVVSVAENQRGICEALAREGVIEWPGHHDTTSVERLAETIRSLIAQPERMRALAQASLTLVDGNGTQRVLERMMAHSGVA